MFSFKYQSFDQNFKSNTIPVERLVVSPILINKYTEDFKENSETPFKENFSLVNNMQNSFFKEAINFSTKDSSLIHQTKSSLFTKELKDQTKKTVESPHQSYQVSQIVFINQLMINGKYLKYFPIIIEPDEELLLNIIHPFEEALNMKIMQIPKSKKVLIDLSLFKKSDDFLLRFKKLKQSYELEEQMITSFTNPKEIIKYFFDKIKYFIHSIQLNYILQKRKTINENLLVNCQKVIEKCNEMAELFFKDFLDTRTLTKALTKNIQEDDKENCSNNINDYLSNNKHCKDIVIYCKFCSKIFSNGCALGGHMSRVHPHKSEQYKKKQKIRERRNEHRRAIYESKKELCYNHDYDYEEMIKTQKGKKDLKKLIIQNKKEYSNILKQVKLSKGLVN